MKTTFGSLFTVFLSCLILYSCMSQEQKEEVLQNSEPQSVDVTVNVGGDSRAERFLGTFDQISRLSLDIDRNYGNKRVVTDYPLIHDGSKWTGTINKLIVGFDYTVTGHAYKCTDCPANFVAVGSNGTILNSNDGSNWVIRSSGTSIELFEVAYGNRTFVAVGETGTILISTDGINWNQRSSGTSADLRSVIYANNLFVISGFNGGILTSVDGNTWTLRNGVHSQVNKNLYGLTYGSNTYISVGETGTVLISNDGISWSPGSSGTSEKLIGVTHNEGSTFLAVGNSGTILTSTDGSTWFEESSGTSKNLSGVSFGNGSFIVVGDDGIILVSNNDADTWTQSESSITQNINTVEFLNNNFYVVGNAGNILASSNGLSWNNLVSGTFNHLKGISRYITLTSDNHTYQEIFRGDTQHTVTEGTNSLNLRLAPLLDDRELTVPRITRINRPFQMVASTSDNITVAVDTVKKDGSSAVDATLSYRFRSVDNDSLPLNNITGGSFSPASGDVTKSGSSYPDISTTYTAPDNDSTMKLQVRVSNELEIGVTSHFNVYVTDDIETQNTVDTNPVIENISAERLDNGDLKWTMNVSNDDGFSGLKVKWEYMFGDNRTFTNKLNTVTQGDSNRGVMQATMSGYQDSDDGMLLVTVCEDGGSAGIPDDCAYMNEASTSISMELIPEAYNKPIICDGNNCNNVPASFDGKYIACNTSEELPKKVTLTLESGTRTETIEFLDNVSGNCVGNVVAKIETKSNYTQDNNSEIAFNNDNITVTRVTNTVDETQITFYDLNYVSSFQLDNSSNLCGQTYWAGITHKVDCWCQTKIGNLPGKGTQTKAIYNLSDNGTLLGQLSHLTSSLDSDGYPSSIQCVGGFAPKDDGIYKDMNCPNSPYPYHWWKMDDPIGSSLLKDSGSAPKKFDGTIRVDNSSGYGLTRNKMASNYVQKSTSDGGKDGDWIDLGNDFIPVPDGSRGFTFSAKVKTIELPYSSYIFSFRDNDIPRNVIALYTYGSSDMTGIVIKEGDGSWLDKNYLSTTNPGYDERQDYFDRTSGNEYMITMTLEQSGNSNNFKLYKNEILSEQWTIDTIEPWNWSGTAVSSLGGEETGTNESNAIGIWGGTIRDVRIYDKALSSSQILDIVNENKSSSNICSL